MRAVVMKFVPVYLICQIAFIVWWVFSKGGGHDFRMLCHIFSILNLAVAMCIAVTS